MSPRANGATAARISLVTLGSRIREAREAKGWTVYRLAKATGVDAANLGRVERDERGVALETAVAISDALGMTIHELLGVPGPRLLRALPGWETASADIPRDVVDIVGRTVTPGAVERITVQSAQLYASAWEAAVKPAQDRLLPGDSTEALETEPKSTRRAGARRARRSG